jgi:hypothetical protein
MAKGMPGFDEKHEAGYSLTLGSVLGLRWFWLDVPDFNAQNPLADGEAGPWKGAPATLRGQMGNPYDRGVMDAYCTSDREAHGQKIPVESCGCGFWAYWTEHAASQHGGGDSWRLPVLGVIEATGRVLHGELGFRAQKAKIVALFPAFKVSFYGVCDAENAEPLAERAMNAWSLTWHSAIETRLEQAYPDARVYATSNAMTANHPPGKGYLFE